MISVTIFINDQPLMARSAVNQGEVKDGVCRYKMDDGHIILHKRADGAVPLAIKMLQKIQEPRPPRPD